MVRAGARSILGVFARSWGDAIFLEKSDEFSRKFDASGGDLEKAKEARPWFA